MKITIITATYNSLATLKEAWESLRMQDYTNWEWVVVDGASSDGTKQWFEQLDDERIQWTSEPDKGIYDALNKGISRSRGDYIGFLHADDLFASPVVLTKIVKHFQRSQGHGVYGDLSYITGPQKRIVRHWKSEVLPLHKLKKGWMPPHPTCFFHRSVYEKVGGFDTQFRIAADYDFLLRSLLSGKFQIEYLSHTITHMRIGGASSKWQNLLRKSKEDIRVLQKNGIPFPNLVVLKKITSKIPQFIRSVNHSQ